MTGQVLKLNRVYMPIDIIDWREAITLWFTEKAEILESYEDKVLHTGNSFAQKKVKDVQSTYDANLDSWKNAMNMPAVIRLFEFVSPKKNIAFYKPFTRKNIHERDGGVCQYCHKPVSLNKMTFDHVIPRSQGGLTCWTNIVCSCLKCNSKKGGKTPEEAGLRLKQKPYAPKLADSFNDGIINRMKDITKVFSNKKWANYIYWNVPLKENE